MPTFIDQSKNYIYLDIHYYTRENRVVLPLIPDDTSTKKEITRVLIFFMIRQISEKRTFIYPTLVKIGSLRMLILKKIFKKF